MEQSIHKIDDLGRLLIPKAIRGPLGWNTGDEILVKSNIEEGTITLYLNGENE